MKKIICLLFLFSFIVISNPVLAQVDEVKTSSIPLSYIGIFSIIVVAIIALIVMGLKSGSEKAAEDDEEYYKKFALSRGLEFHEKDIFSLAQELQGTPFEKTSANNENFLNNILTQSDNDSHLYLFYRHIPAERSTGHSLFYTVCFFKLNKGYEVNLNLRIKAPGFLEKTVHSLTGEELKAVSIPGNEKFNKEFVIYTDKQDMAVRLISGEVIEYCSVNKKRFFIPEHIITQIRNDKLIIYVQHTGFKKNFKDESQLADFLELAKGLKERLLVNH